MFHPLAEPYRDLFERPRSFIFLISHMRSYSSLLGHLLASTPEVDGYSELHQSYASDLDLVRMAVDVQNTYPESLHGSRLFDKLLHRGSTLDPVITNRPDVHVVLAARTPGPTLASMIQLGTRDPSVKWASKPGQALLHYQRRLEDIQKIATQLDHGALLITDEVLRDTETKLQRLADFLGLDTIPDTYAMQAKTGHRRFGDSSPHIFKGSIQRDGQRDGQRDDQRDDQRDMTAVPADVLSEATASFQSFITDPAVTALVTIGELELYQD